MNLTERKIEKKAKQFAEDLLEQAEKNEPPITADLQNIALGVSVKIIGLEYKFKSHELLAEKITQKAANNARIFVEAGYLPDEAIEKAFKLQIEKINDALRYTFILSFESYVFDLGQLLEKLKRKGFVIPKNKIWNAWRNVETKYDTGYRGINATIISSQGQKFELQFHTKESFQLKMKTHTLYKEAVSAKTSAVRKNEIIQMMVEFSKSILIPKGVTKI